MSVLFAGEGTSIEKLVAFQRPGPYTDGGTTTAQFTVWYLEQITRGTTDPGAAVDAPPNLARNLSIW